MSFEECDVCHSVFRTVEDLTRHEDLEHNVIEWFEEDLLAFADTSAASDYHCTLTQRPPECNSEVCSPPRDPCPENEGQIGPRANPKAPPETDSEIVSFARNHDPEQERQINPPDTRPESADPMAEQKADGVTHSDSETDSEANSISNSSSSNSSRDSSESSSGSDSSDSSSDSEADSETDLDTDSLEDPGIGALESESLKVQQPTDQSTRPIVIDNVVNENGSTEGLSQSLDRLDSNILSDQRFHFTVETPACQHCGEAFSCESSLKVHWDFSRGCSGPNNPSDVGRVGGKRPNLRQSTMSRRVDYAQLEGNTSDQEGHARKRVRLADVSQKQRNDLPRRRRGKENSFKVKCDECNGVFPCMSKLVRHVGQVHKLARPFACKVCGLGFKADHHLRRHEELHLRPLISCSQCSEQFVTPWLLNRHVNAQHKVFKCDICVRVFKSGKQLYRHTQTHHRKKPDGAHACKICGKPLPSKLLKEIHERTHSTERPFSCDQCDKTFKHRRNLEGHKKTVHNEVRSFMCSICGDAFKRKSHLEAHLRVVHTP